MGDKAFSGAISKAITGSTDAAGLIPGVNFVFAVASGNIASFASSTAALLYSLNMFPGGQIVAAVITVLQMAGVFGKEEPPLMHGHASAQWDAQGGVRVFTEINVQGGGPRAADILSDLTGGVQGAVTAISRGPDGQAQLALIPHLLPRLTYVAQPSRDNGDVIRLHFINASGHEETRSYNAQGNAAYGKDGMLVIPGSGDPKAMSALQKDFFEQSQRAIVPAWVARNAHQGYANALDNPSEAARLVEQQITELEAEALSLLIPEVITRPHYDDPTPPAAGPVSTNPERTAQINLDLAGLKAQRLDTSSQAIQWMQLASDVNRLGQQAGVSADGQTQTLGVLTFTVESNLKATPPGPVKRILLNIDKDDYLERVDWFAGNQAVLAVDLNLDGTIEAGELIRQENLYLLDTNHDGVLDSRDASFLALRVWIDVNGDGQSWQAIPPPAGAHDELKAALKSGDELRIRLAREAVAPKRLDETSSLADKGITSISFKNGALAIHRANGTSQALTAQTLTGTVLGVQYAVQAGTQGLIQISELPGGASSSTVLGVNTRGNRGVTHGGGPVGGTGTSGSTGTAGTSTVITSGDFVPLVRPPAPAPRPAPVPAPATGVTPATPTVAPAPPPVRALTVGDGGLRVTTIAPAPPAPRAAHLTADSQISAAVPGAVQAAVAAQAQQIAERNAAIAAATAAAQAHLQSTAPARLSPTTPAFTVAQAMTPPPPNGAAQPVQPVLVRTNSDQGIYIAPAQVISGQSAGSQTSVQGVVHSAGAVNGAQPTPTAAPGPRNPLGVLPSATNSGAPEQIHITTGSSQLSSAPASSAGSGFSAPTANRQVAFVPLTSSNGTPAQARADVTAQMIASADTGLFGGGGMNAALIGLALGASAAAQAGQQGVGGGRPGAPEGAASAANPVNPVNALAALYEPAYEPAYEPNSPAAQSNAGGAAINSGAAKHKAANESGYRMTA